MKTASRLLLVSIIALVLDALTKAWAEQALTLYYPVPILGDLFRLTLGYNTGVAFGLFANGGSGPLILTGIIIFGMAVWFLWAIRSGEFPPLAVWPIGLILGGAIGNFVDRWPDMRVIDFLDMGIGATRWPTFNLADVFVVFGASILLLIALAEKPLSEGKS